MKKGLALGQPSVDQSAVNLIHSLDFCEPCLDYLLDMKKLFMLENKLDPFKKEKAVF